MKKIIIIFVVLGALVLGVLYYVGHAFGPSSWI